MIDLNILDYYYSVYKACSGFCVAGFAVYCICSELARECCNVEWNQITLQAYVDYDLYLLCCL